MGVAVEVHKIDGPLFRKIAKPIRGANQFGSWDILKPFEIERAMPQFQARDRPSFRYLRDIRGRSHHRQHYFYAALGQKPAEIERITPHAANRIGGH
jgi:hypothetical protein